MKTLLVHATAENCLPVLKKTRVVICYSLISGYVSACWRALALRPDIDLFVIAFSSTDEDLVDYSTELLSVTRHRLLSIQERNNHKLVFNLVNDLKPDILMIGGWSHKPYRQFYYSKTFSDVPIILMMDNPYRGDFRQFIGRFALRMILNRISFLFVPGERSWRLGRYWGVPEQKIRRGVLSIDYESLKNVYELRSMRTEGWPKSFLYLGRYLPRKGVETLLKAYRLYRTSRPDPWPLRCAGMGPLTDLLESEEGVVNLGFVQPKDLPLVLQDAGAFVLASRYEPWGLVIIEAAAAGLPILCTEACGASTESVRFLYNGLITSTDDPIAFSEGLMWLHDNYPRLSEMGARSRELSAPFSAEMWADRVIEMVRKLS